MAINLIVSVTDDWAIGKDGQLLVRNPADMRLFKNLTTNYTVVMGRKTFESLPGQKPLKDRRNIVLSSHEIPDVEVAHSVEDVLDLITPEETVWIIGGASVYKTFLDKTAWAYVTVNHTTLPADTYFPNLNKDPNWQLFSTELAGKTPDNIEFEYSLYKHV